MLLMLSGEKMLRWMLVESKSWIGGDRSHTIAFSSLGGERFGNDIVIFVLEAPLSINTLKQYWPFTTLTFIDHYWTWSTATDYEPFYHFLTMFDHWLVTVLLTWKQNCSNLYLNVAFVPGYVGPCCPLFCYSTVMVAGLQPHGSSVQFLDQCCTQTSFSMNWFP